MRTELASVVASTLVAVLASLAPATAEAQILTPWPYLPLQITPSLGIEERYTDNVLLTHDRIDDFRTTLFPGLHLSLTTGRNSSDILYTLGVTHSTAFGDNPRFSHSLAADNRFSLTERIFLSVREALHITDEPGLADARGVLRQGAKINANTTSAGLGYQGDLHRGELTYAHTAVTREVLQPTVPGSSQITVGNQRFDSLIDAYGANGRFRLGDRTVGTALASYTDARFTNQGATVNTSLVPFASGFTGYDVTAGVERQIDDLTTLLGTGTWELRQPRGVGEDITIWKGLLTLTREFGTAWHAEGAGGFDVVQGGLDFTSGAGFLRLRYTGSHLFASVEAGQSLIETFNQTVNAGIIQARDAAVEVGYAFTDNLRLGARASYYHTKFLQPAVAVSQGLVTNPTSTHPETTYYTVGPTLTMQLGRVFSLLVSYTYRIRDESGQSGSTAGSVDSNTVTIRLTAIYQ